MQIIDVCQLYFPWFIDADLLIGSVQNSVSFF